MMSRTESMNTASLEVASTLLLLLKSPFLIFVLNLFIFCLLAFGLMALLFISLKNALPSVMLISHLMFRERRQIPLSLHFARLSGQSSFIILFQALHAPSQSNALSNAFAA